MHLRPMAMCVILVQQETSVKASPLYLSLKASG